MEEKLFYTESLCPAHHQELNSGLEFALSMLHDHGHANIGKTPYDKLTFQYFLESTLKTEVLCLTQVFDVHPTCI